MEKKENGENRTNTDLKPSTAQSILYHLLQRAILEDYSLDEFRYVAKTRTTARRVSS